MEVAKSSDWDFLNVFWRLLFLIKLTFSKCSFMNTIRMSNSLGPDQVRRFVGPDLSPNCLQRLSADYQQTTIMLLVGNKYVTQQLILGFVGVYSISLFAIRRRFRISNMLTVEKTLKINIWQMYFFVESDQGPNNLQRLSADNTSRQTVKTH